MAIEPTRGSLLKKYVFWTYERGSFHYDVMVTLILLFIFISPHIIEFGDRPVPEPEVRGHDVLVQASGGGVFVYQVSAKEVKSATSEEALQAQLISSIEPIAGRLQLDRYEKVNDPGGHLTAYKVFAHRLADSRVQ